MLTRIALRLAAVEALKGRTLIGDNVTDSTIGALDVSADGALRTDEDRPFIAVYTDGGRAADLQGRLMHHSGQTDLVFEIGVTTAMLDRDDDTGQTAIVGIPSTDGALEFFLDLVGHQIVAALKAPDNAWADIWRSLSSSISSIERKRVADATSGTRMAAQQMVVTLDLLADPVAGEPLRETSAMYRFLSAAVASDDVVLQLQAQKMAAALAGSVEPWRGDIARFGVTETEAEAMQWPESGLPIQVVEVRQQ